MQRALIASAPVLRHRRIHFALATTCLLGVSFACRDRERSRPPAQLTVSHAAPAEAVLGEGLSLRRWQVTADVSAYVARLDPKAWELVSVSAQQLRASEGAANGSSLNDETSESLKAVPSDSAFDAPNEAAREAELTAANAPARNAVPHPSANDPTTRRTAGNAARDIADWDEGERRAPVSTLATFVGATLAVNGGYFDENGRVLGLRATRAHRFSPLRQADWGVFSIAGSTPLVQHTRDADDIRDGFAVQCGPRLVVEGKPLTFKPGAHHRTAIGYDGNGWVSVLVTLDPVELEDLAAALAKPNDQGGLGLIAALNLDGGPSTAMYVGGVHTADWSIPSPTPVADAVAVVPRGAALPWEARDVETH